MHWPSTAFSSVDLPAPLGPMMPTNSPSLTTRLQPLRMLTSGMYPATETRVALEDASDRSTSSLHRLELLVEQRLALVGAEVGVDHRRVGASLVGRALGDHPALGHHDHPVGDVVHHVHVVLDEQHGHPLVAQARGCAR